MRRNVWLVRLYMSTMHFAPFLTIWVVYLTDYRDLTLTQVAIMEAFFWGVSMVAEIPTGAFADRYGRRLTFMVGSSVEAAGILAFGLASNYELLLFSYVLWATGIAFGSGNSEAFLYDTMAEAGAEAGYAQEVGRLNALQIGPGLVGGFLGGLVAAVTTLQVPILGAVSVYAIALVLATMMREPQRVAEADGAASTYFATLLNAGRLLHRDAAVRWIIVFIVMSGLAGMSEWILLQPFLSSHEVPLAWFGVAIIPVRVTGVLASLGGHRYFEFAGIRRALLGTFLLTVTGLALLAIVDHVLAFAGVVLIQLAGALRRPSVNAYINARTSSSVRATVLSISPFGMSLSLALTLPFIGLAADEGIRLAFLVLGTVVFAGAGLSYVLWLRADARESLLAPPPQPLPVAVE
jgi:MFS family permease